MHLYANSMNVLSRLQSNGTRIVPEKKTASPVSLRGVYGLSRGFEVHRLSGWGSMAGEWDGDARRPNGRSSRHEDVPVRVEEEVVVEEPSIFWG